MEAVHLPDLRFPSGLKLPPRRYTAGFAAPDVALPAAVTLIGDALVAVGDTVAVGQPVALWCDTPVCSGVSGTVTDICNVPLEDGRLYPAVCIAADGQQSHHTDLAPHAPQGRAAFVSAVRAAGIFDGEAPLWKALQTAVPADVLLVNAVETEPYLAATHRLLAADSAAVLRGMQIIMEYLDIPRAVIAVGRDGGSTVRALRRACAEMSAPRRMVKVRTVAPRYPYAHAAFLVRHLCGRTVPHHARPESVGVPVIGAAACAAASVYMETGMPAVARRITVDGSCIRHPQTLTVPHGTPFSHIIDHCGGRAHTSESDRLIVGGPLSGTAVGDADLPVRPHHTALLCLGKEEWCDLPETTCMRCGRCSDVCLVRLNPCEIEKALAVHDTPLLSRLHADACIHCGACAYVCPSRRPLATVMHAAQAALQREEDRT